MTGETVIVRIAGPLRFLLPARHRDGVLVVAVDGSSTVVHVVESLGVPRTEVGQVHVNGQPAGVSARLRDNDVVDVPERPRPQPVSRGGFLLDVHLGTLARRLRLLGVDTAYRNDAGDDELVAQANAEQRVLLTKDRGLLRRRSLAAGGFVRGERPDDQLADVLDRFAPPRSPWTRCPACNGAVHPVAKPEVEHLLPPGTRRSYTRFSRCGSCGRIYWRGAHSRRLDAIVEGYAPFSADLPGGPEHPEVESDDPEPAETDSHDRIFGHDHGGR
jgi:uncharacterized protein with PIN domain